ncbi:MAG TPA: hypothetical protein EYP28_00240 [Methanophagales archaeon]|nr:hypothetical protein [Methanophagales archaeon]
MGEEVGFEFDESSSLLKVRLVETVELGLSEPSLFHRIMSGYLQYPPPPNYAPVYGYAYAPTQIPR